MWECDKGRETTYDLRTVVDVCRGMDSGSSARVAATAPAPIELLLAAAFGPWLVCVTIATSCVKVLSPQLARMVNRATEERDITAVLVSDLLH